MAVRESGISEAPLDHPGVRTDGETGTREIVEFFGSRSEKLFGCRYIPGRAAIGALVICSSIHAEHLNSYRTEVLLGRAVAARGIAVERFQYRGHGHSDGESADATFETMVEDALDAVERIVATTGTSKLAFLGTRWGALIAAAAAYRYPGVPLALWDPVTTTDQFFKDAFRAKRIHELRQGIEASSSEELLAQLRTQGLVDVFGYPIDRATYDSSVGRTLAGELGESERPVFIGQIGPGKDPRGHYRRVMEGWSTAAGRWRFRSSSKKRFPGSFPTRASVRKVGSLWSTRRPSGS